MRFASMFAGLALLAVFPADAATKPVPELTEIDAKMPVNIKADRAYFLLRMHRPKGIPAIEPVFLRVPTVKETADYWAAKAAAFDKAKPKLEKERQKALDKQKAAEKAGQKYSGTIPPEPSLAAFTYIHDAVQNVSSVRHNKALVRGDPDNVYLVEAVPGDYILYGASWGMGYSGLHVCWCLGTIGFSAKAGEIVDLGTFFSDGAKFRSKIPELADETGFGPSSDTPFVLLAGTMRAPKAGASIPNLLSGKPIVPVRYHAVGKFVDGNAGGVNRLGPIPGILGYERGKVIDVATGQTAADNY